MKTFVGSDRLSGGGILSNLRSETCLSFQGFYQPHHIACVTHCVLVAVRAFINNSIQD